MLEAYNSGRLEHRGASNAASVGSASATSARIDARVVKDLMDTFPSWDKESIVEVLESSGGSAEIAIETLLEVRFFVPRSNKQLMAPSPVDE
jgi:hypothetical protein